LSTHKIPPEDQPEAGRDAELSWMAAVAATLLVVIIAILAAAT
jgi:hypothetical protein